MELRNAFKGISEMVQRMIDATMPRQAIVTRFEGKGVWVRFTPVDPNVPESYYPANIARLPVGTAGWVHPLAGGKGRFIADAVRVPGKPQSGNSWSTQSVSTAGDYVFTAETALLTFSGLAPGASYELSWTVQLNWWTSVAATGRIGVRVTDNNGHTFVLGQSRDMRHTGAVGTTVAERSWSYSTSVTALPDGTVQVCPVFRWASGTTNFQNTYILARID